MGENYRQQVAALKAGRLQEVKERAVLAKALREEGLTVKEPGSQDPILLMGDQWVLDFKRTRSDLAIARSEAQGYVDL